MGSVHVDSELKALEARVGIAESLVVSTGSLSRAWQSCRLTES